MSGSEGRPTSIPITLDGRVVYHYEIANLFSKFGNYDGDNCILLEISYVLHSAIRGLGYELEIYSSIHNPACIWGLERGPERWENEYAHSDDIWGDGFAELWDSLPEDVRELLADIAERRLALEEVLALLDPNDTVTAVYDLLSMGLGGAIPLLMDGILELDEDSLASLLDGLAKSQWDVVEGLASMIEEEFAKGRDGLRQVMENVALKVREETYLLLKPLLESMNLDLADISARRLIQAGG